MQNEAKRWAFPRARCKLKTLVYFHNPDIRTMYVINNNLGLWKNFLQDKLGTRTVEIVDSLVFQFWLLLAIFPIDRV